MGFFDKKIEGKTAQEWLKLAYSTDDYYLQIKYCDNALSAKKELGQAWMKKGFALGCINDYKESMKCCIEYLKIIEKDTNQFDVSGYITAYILLGANAHNLHAYDGAIKFYDDAIDMCEKIMNDQKMLNIFNLKMDDIKSQCSSLWGHKMDVYIASSQWNEVEKCLDMRIKYNPKDTEAIKLKAGTLKSSKKYTDALQIYNKILEVDPIHLESLSSKAECFKELKQYNEAIQTINIALRTYPRTERLWEMKGEILRNIGKYEEALDAYNKVLEINPNNKEITNNITQLNTLLQKEKSPKISIPPLTQKMVAVSDKPIEILCIIIKKHNISLISNPPVFTGIIKDYYKGEYKREVKILTTSIEENIPQDLLAKKDKIPFAVLSGQFVQRLEDCGFSSELSVWAVDAWAKALEVE